MTALPRSAQAKAEHVLTTAARQSQTLFGMHGAAKMPHRYRETLCCMSTAVLL
jgi:hypothetical protein